MLQLAVHQDLFHLKLIRIRIVRHNKFLYAAFGLDNGSDGVDKFAKLAGGDVGRMARELASKVVGKLKDVYLEDDL